MQCESNMNEWEHNIVASVSIQDLYWTVYPFLARYVRCYSIVWEFLQRNKRVFFDFIYIHFRLNMFKPLIRITIYFGIFIKFSRYCGIRRKNTRSFHLVFLLYLLVVIQSIFHMVKVLKFENFEFTEKVSHSRKQREYLLSIFKSLLKHWEINSQQDSIEKDRLKTNGTNREKEIENKRHMRKWIASQFHVTVFNVCMRVRVSVFVGLIVSPWILYGCACAFIWDCQKRNHASMCRINLTANRLYP